MNNLTRLLKETRDNTRGDEALLRRILSQIPEKQKKRSLLSPYIAYTFTSFVSVYMLILVALPIYREYKAYRVENDIELMAIDEADEKFDLEMNVMEDRDLQTLD